MKNKNTLKIQKLKNNLKELKADYKDASKKEIQYQKLADKNHNLSCKLFWQIRELEFKLEVDF
jgi:hypothetical protein